jgi:hypothetical protein
MVDDDALRRRQLVDGGEHDVERLALGECLFGQPLPIARVGPPVAGERVVGATEAIGLDGGLPAHGRQRGERHGAGVGGAARLGPVDEDPQDPRPQRRAALEAVEALQDAEPCLLDDLLGDGAARDVVAGDGEHRRVVALDQRLEGALVPGAQALEQLLLLGGSRRLDLGLGHELTLTAPGHVRPGRNGWPGRWTSPA